MSTAREFALEIAERIDGLGPIFVRRFFNGAGLVADDVQFAFVIGGALYLKVDDELRRDFEAMGAKPFVYEGKRKPVTISSYYETPEDVIYDEQELRRWAVRSHRAATAARLRRSPKKKRSAPTRKKPKVAVGQGRKAAASSKVLRKSVAKAPVESPRPRRTTNSKVR